MPWEQLSHALERIMATGVTEKKAKLGICDAIANQKIKLRLVIMVRLTRMDFLTGRDIRTREVHLVEREDIPPILRLGDFDWQRSRIRTPELWQKARGSSGSLFGNWKVVETAHYRQAGSIPDSQRGGRALTYEHRVELRSSDVTKIFNMSKERAPTAPKPKSATGAKWQGVKAALLTLYPPHGIRPAGLTAKDAT